MMIPPDPHSSISVDAIDEEIRTGLRTLAFAPSTERLFLREYLHKRVRMVPLWARQGSLFYLLSIPGDHSMVPDVVHIGVLLRLAVFLPYAIFTVIWLRLRPTPATYDMLAFGVSALGVGLPMVAFIFSQSTYLFAYQTGSLVPLPSSSLFSGHVL